MASAGRQDQEPDGPAFETRTKTPLGARRVQVVLKVAVHPKADGDADTTLMTPGQHAGPPVTALMTPMRTR